MTQNLIIKAMEMMTQRRVSKLIRSGIKDEDQLYDMIMAKAKDEKLGLEGALASQGIAIDMFDDVVRKEIKKQLGK